MSSNSPQDRHTFVFVDLAGFTALTEAHGDEEAAELAGQFCTRMRTVAPRFGGEVIKSIGDAVMIRCEMAESAIHLALTIIDEEDARSEFPSVRIGMHTGPAVEREGDWYGATVNVAARVSAAAGGGEVVLTEATADQAGTIAEVELQRLGSTEFKNVSEAVSLYRAARSGEQREDAVVDPVCRMTIADGHSAGTLTFEGTTFHFCSLACAGKFTAAPERFSPRN